jgi:hypothetical protein
MPLEKPAVSLILTDNPIKLMGKRIPNIYCKTLRNLSVFA